MSDDELVEIGISKFKKYTFFGLEFDSLKNAANYFDVSVSLMSAIFSGKKRPSKRMLEVVGYEMTITKTIEYVPINKRGESDR